MKAIPVLNRRTEINSEAFVQLVIWKVAEPIRGSSHHFKYRLVFVVDNVCVIRFDNEAGKGDHIHYGNREEPYVFSDLETLLDDFEHAVLGWRR